mmetsp:Transcript_127210/g.360043  ORF Transcript_127210/g.360043 Transcript_127210/m.360043 type:complete len:216 (+) Transcript_127210:112-759(+)|eukprot:CAMPEP_0179239932 /NCGR_PEP_ID=MMETSP0797-20121207/15715_1 /TAXON_ID=47934 /ORGANISM="Dinophysis acuminata, Strain DAEP01" /LENGTH=215 /DNA_ID=CAMNT_0020947269 /DNA_START=86 /DNA_END=733 /DNA_ORIENTATION=-
MGPCLSVPSLPSLNFTDESPFLTEYWEKIDADPVDEEDLRETIEHAFNQYDADEDGVLDQEESDAFFIAFVCKFVAQEPKRIYWVVVPEDGGVMKEVGAIVNEIGSMNNNMNMDVMKKARKYKYRGNVEWFQKYWKDLHYAYYTNREELNAKAFAVIDVNGNNHFELEELIEALTPETQKHHDLLVALGLPTMCASSGTMENLVGPHQMEPMLMV